MTITYPITFPTTPAPSQVEWIQRHAVKIQRNPFTLEAQIYQHDGEAWAVNVSYDPLFRSEAAPLIAALTALRGPVGTFLFGDSIMSSPQGTGAGSPRVYGASQTGTVLTTDGWGVSQVILKAGDFFQIDYALYQVLQDVTSNGSGVASIDVWPRLRAHEDNAVIVTASPKLLLRLSESSFTPISADREQLYNVSFTAEEAI